MPTFQFLCRSCGRREDRIIFYEEIPVQACFTCGSQLQHEFVPTRSKPVVYTRNSGYSDSLTGPRQKARYLREKNLIELGDAPASEVNSEMDRLHRDHQKRQEAEIHKEALGIVSELGSELYTSGPARGAES